MEKVTHDDECEASARARAKLTLWGAELKDGCGCGARAAVAGRGRTADIGIATLRPGKYEVAVGDKKIGTVLGDYASGFRAVLIDGTVLRLLYDTPADAAEALATHLAFVVDAEIESWAAECPGALAKVKGA